MVTHKLIFYFFIIANQNFISSHVINSHPRTIDSTNSIDSIIPIESKFTSDSKRRIESVLGSPSLRNESRIYYPLLGGEIQGETFKPILENSQKKFIRKKRFFWNSNSDGEVSTANSDTTLNPQSTPKSSDDGWFKSWYHSAAGSIKNTYKKAKETLKKGASKVKEGFKKAGRKIARGFQRVRSYFSRTDDKFAIFANNINERVANGDEKAIELLKKLGIHLSFENGIAKNATVDDADSDLKNTLKEMGLLVNSSTTVEEAVTKRRPVETSTIPQLLSTQSTTETSSFYVTHSEPRITKKSTKEILSNISTREYEYPEGSTAVFDKEDVTNVDLNLITVDRNKTEKVSTLSHSTNSFTTKPSSGSASFDFTSTMDSISTSRFVSSHVAQIPTTSQSSIPEYFPENTKFTSHHATSMKPTPKISTEDLKTTNTMTTQNVTIKMKTTEDGFTYSTPEDVAESHAPTTNVATAQTTDSQKETTITKTSTPESRKSTSILTTTQNIITSFSDGTTTADVTRSKEQNNTEKILAETSSENYVTPTVTLRDLLFSTNEIKPEHLESTSEITKPEYSTINSVVTENKYSNAATELITSRYSTLLSDASTPEYLSSSHKETESEYQTTTFKTTTAEINKSEYSTTTPLMTEHKYVNPTTESITPDYSTTFSSDVSTPEYLSSSRKETTSEYQTTTSKTSSTEINKPEYSTTTPVVTENKYDNATTQYITPGYSTLSADVSTPEFLSSSRKDTTSEYQTTTPKTTKLDSTSSPSEETNSSFFTTTEESTKLTTTPKPAAENNNLASTAETTTRFKSSTTQSTTEKLETENTSFEPTNISIYSSTTLKLTTTHVPEPTGPTEPLPFPDIFNESKVRDRLHDIFVNADFNHDELRNTFNFDPALYEDYYDYY